jgi:hypothetical protein
MLIIDTGAGVKILSLARRATAAGGKILSLTRQANKRAEEGLTPLARASG